MLPQATASFRDALAPEAAAQLVSVGRVPLVACGGSEEQVFTLPVYHGMSLGQPPCVTITQASLPAPSAPDAEEGLAHGGSSDDAS